MADEPDWHNLIQAAVRECVRTWELQARAGPVKPKAREAIVSRAVVLLMQWFEGHPPHLVVALLRGLLRTMLATVVDVLAERPRP